MITLCFLLCFHSLTLLSSLAFLHSMWSLDFLLSWLPSWDIQLNSVLGISTKHMEVPSSFSSAQPFCNTHQSYFNDFSTWVTLLTNAKILITAMPQLFAWCILIIQATCFHYKKTRKFRWKKKYPVLKFYNLKDVSCELLRVCICICKCVYHELTCSLYIYDFVLCHLFQSLFPSVNIILFCRGKQCA